MNAYTYFESVKKEGEYLKLKNGLSKISEKCAELFGKNIKFASKVSNIICKQKYYITCTKPDSSESKFICDNLYLCTSLKAANEIKFESCPEIINYLSKCKYQSCLRFYIKFKKPVLNKVNWTSICGHIKSIWITKLDDYTVLGPYVDSIQADDMKKLTNQQIVDNLLYDIKMYTQSSDQDLSVQTSIGAYWEDAIEILSPSFYETNQNLFHVRDTFKCTVLPKPNDQGWMNGSLYTI